MKELTQREKVLAWLDSIGEFDPACIAEVIEACRTDPEARKYFVGMYSKAKK